MFTKRRQLIFLLMLFITISVVSASNFKLATYYADHMVLQMEPSSAVIWGYADLKANISLDLKGKVYNTVAEPANFTSLGVWRVTLDPQPPSGPFTITITSYSLGVKESATLEDVLFGDVWVCSGQSNMAFNVMQSFNGSVAVEESYRYPNIRVLSVTQRDVTKPQYDIGGFYKPWSRPSPDVLDDQDGFLYFSAVCWLFGRNLYDHFKYPIGLISSNWGGTPVEAWSSPAVLKKCGVERKSLDVLFNSTRYFKSTGPHDASGLWNAMIHPLINMTIKGAIWYQGEANTVNPGPYRCLFQTMIEDWRGKWYEGTGKQTNPTFPFGFVQLATSDNPVKEKSPNYTALRWHQTYDYGYTPNPQLPNVFMAVAVDLLDLSSPYGAIHPRYKQDVADRLTLGARSVAYGEGDVVFQGPFPSAVLRLATDELLVEFNNGNVVLSMNNVSGFDACCSTSPTACPLVGDKSPWTPVTSAYNLTKANVSMQDPCVTQGLRASVLRYIWHDLACPSYKQCPLYDANSLLPVPPFITQIAQGKRPKWQ